MKYSKKHQKSAKITNDSKTKQSKHKTELSTMNQRRNTDGGSLGGGAGDEDDVAGGYTIPPGLLDEEYRRKDMQELEEHLGQRDVELGGGSLDGGSLDGGAGDEDDVAGGYTIPPGLLDEEYRRKDMQELEEHLGQVAPAVVNGEQDDAGGEDGAEYSFKGGGSE